MKLVSCGGIDYTSYVGDIKVVRLDGTEITFGKPKSLDEDAQLRIKQKLQDGDRILVGKQSAICIMGNPKDGMTQMVLAFPESEFSLSTTSWEHLDKKKNETRKGCGIAHFELLRGIFKLVPGGCTISSPHGEIKATDAKGKDAQLIVEVMHDLMMVMPSTKTQVKNTAGGTHTCTPAFGTMGLTELIVTPNAVYEKKMEIDARVQTFSGKAMEFATILNPDMIYEESTAQFTHRKQKETRAALALTHAQQANAMKELKTLPASALGMAPEGVEFAKMMSEQFEKSSGSPATFSANMLANLNLEMMKNLPGLTEEQRRQVEESIPEFSKLQKELKANGQLGARVRLSEKMIETIATDPVAKKKRMAQRKEALSILENFSPKKLPPYPKLDSKFKVA